MNKNYAAILSLIKSALTGVCVVVPKDVDWDLIFRLCQSHQIIPMICYGMINSDLQFPQKQLFLDGTMQAALVEQEQLNMFSQICRKFSEAKVDYLPLKGLILKNLYPKTEMRVMSDMDILIREEQLEKVSEILTQMGCREQKESDHVMVYRKEPYVYLEMHTRLIPSYDRDYYAYFKDGWKRAVPNPEQQNRYNLTQEDMFLFEIVHLAKHYREGGIGLRHFVDIWVLLTNDLDLDMSYIRRELRVLKMERFFDNILATLQYWFDDAPATEITEFLTERTFQSGSYGTLEKHQTAVATRIGANHGGAKKGRFLELFYAVFMPLREMKKRYHCLHRYPVLLPIFWVVRWVVAVFGESKNIKARIERLQRINEAELNEYNSELAFVGLQFDLSEPK